jgi:hypothetical protein
MALELRPNYSREDIAQHAARIRDIPPAER